MGKFTGRPNSGGLKRFGTALLNGLDAMATASHDSPIRTRINEIDELIPNLKQERDHLIHSLYEPGDLTVSEDYDPNWVKVAETAKQAMVDGYNGGRLTKCKGQWSATAEYTDEHPGCPYKGTRHNAHEFTLKD